jgi:N-acetylglucosaminyldiphosphoundecaprenol N-acetyl-beta-D-mannosaminyltransferase
VFENVYRTSVLGARIHALDWSTAVRVIRSWSRQRESRFVCFCNVHVVVTASRESDFMEVINAADLAMPDGAPVAWMLRRLGFKNQARLGGPDLMWRYCEAVNGTDESVYLYGSTERTLVALKANLLRAFPRLHLAGAYSPPFRPMSEDEEDTVAAMINASGANVVFVGLGCPKQERWMAAQRGRIRAVMIGVGAAFDYHAGVTRRAPQWMQRWGLEWLHRLASEPRRLWRRYLVTNTLFILSAVMQLLGRQR